MLSRGLGMAGTQTRTEPDHGGTKGRQLNCWPSKRTQKQFTQNKMLSEVASVLPGREGPPGVGGVGGAYEQKLGCLPPGLPRTVPALRAPLPRIPSIQKVLVEAPSWLRGRTIRRTGWGPCHGPLLLTRSLKTPSELRAGCSPHNSTHPPRPCTRGPHRTVRAPLGGLRCESRETAGLGLGGGLT